MIEILDVHIDEIEKLLSKDSEIKFEQDSREIIKCMKPCFVQACPGSGKTTALIAKLAILADKLPPNQNICVLSHTNVAKDEIRKRLGNKANKLLRYPNFIGTIQSFVDKYLAIPAAIQEFKTRPKEIDSEGFERKISQRLSFQTRNFLLNKKVDFENIDFNFDDVNQLNKPYSSISAGEEKHYAFLRNKSLEVKKEGFLTYNDAYALANLYLNKYPNISSTFAKRFSLVFIDEVQDTSEQQLKIIAKAFKGSCVQYFGDNNQNLYNPATDILQAIKKIDPNTNDASILRISNTYRLSPQICGLSQHLGRNAQKLCCGKNYICGKNGPEGCVKCTQCNNTIILYDDNSIKNVLPLYAQIIKIQKKVKPAMGNCFKAVGNIAKEFNPDDKKARNGVIKRSLPDYAPDYIRTSKINGISMRQITDFKLGLSYTRSFLKEKNFKEAKNILLKIITKFALMQKIDSISNIKSVFEYFKTLNKNEDLNKFIFYCCNTILEQEVEDDVIKSKLINLFEVPTLNNKAAEFLNTIIENSKEEISMPPKKTNNIYKAPNGIKIELDTIAGIKGETHDSTLLLETFYRQKDLNKFIPKVSKMDLTNAEKKVLDGDKRLNSIYVAMTRPKHLLCLAMHKDGYDEKYRSNLENLGWKINAELIQN